MRRAQIHISAADLSRLKESVFPRLRCTVTEAAAKGKRGSAAEEERRPKMTLKPETKPGAMKENFEFDGNVPATSPGRGNRLSSATKVASPALAARAAKAAAAAAAAADAEAEEAEAEAAAEEAKAQADAANQAKGAEKEAARKQATESRPSPRPSTPAPARALHARLCSEYDESLVAPRPP